MTVTENNMEEFLSMTEITRANAAQSRYPVVQQILYFTAVGLKCTLNLKEDLE